MDIFNPTSWEIIKVPSPDLSGFVPYTWATWDVDLWTHSYEWNSVTLNANIWNDWPTLWAELLDDTGWTSTGWTGSWSTGWWSTPINPNILSRAVSISIWQAYLVKIIWWGELEVTLWWVLTYLDFDWEATFKVTAISTDWIFVKQLSYYGELLRISVKEYISDKTAIFSIYDSTNTKTFEIQSTTSTAKNMNIGLSSGGKILGWYENVSLWAYSLTNLSNWYQNFSCWYKSSNSLLNWYRNVSLWAYSLYSSVNRAYNIAIWAYSMYSNTWWSNIAIWYRALENGTSNGNTGIWQSSLQNLTSGYSNLWIWVSSLWQITTGTYNIGIGESAWLQIASFANNNGSTSSIFIWWATKASIANQTNEIVIGHQAVGNGSNTVTLWHTDITKTYLRWDIYPVDAKNIVLGTTTGMKIGTATNQKIGFFNATPIVQVGATIDLWVVLSNLWLRAAGTAYPITTSGATSFTGTINLWGQVTVANAINFAINTSTGTKIGTGNTQKIWFWNATPVVQPWAYTQTYSTATRTHANLTSSDIGAFTGGIIGFLDAAERDNLRTQINALRADVTNLKQVVNALIDDHQSIGLAS